MKALVYGGPGKIEVKDKPKPEIKEPHDAIVKLLRTTIWYVVARGVDSTLPYICRLRRLSLRL